MFDGWTDGMDNAWTGAVTDVTDDEWTVGIFYQGFMQVITVFFS